MSALNLRKKALGIDTAATDERVDGILSMLSNACLFQPAGESNTSRHVCQTVNGREYLARANDDATAEQIKLRLTQFGSRAVFNLMRTRFDWDIDMAHHYKHGDEVSVTTPTLHKLYEVKPNATLDQLRINPTSPNVSAADSAYKFVRGSIPA